jgi:hypothetical protein
MLGHSMHVGVIICILILGITPTVVVVGHVSLLRMCMRRAPIVAWTILVTVHMHWGQSR